MPGKREEVSEVPEEAQAELQHELAALEWQPVERKDRTRKKLVRQALRSSMLFEDLANRHWQRMEELVHFRRFDPEEVIFRQGTPGLGLYVIVEGEVHIVREVGEEVVLLAKLEKGDFFGEMELVDPSERSASAIAKAPVTLAGIFRPELKRLFKQQPRLGMTIYERIARIVIQRLRRADERLQALGPADMSDRES